MFSYKQITFLVILWLSCETATAEVVSKSTNPVYTRRPYGAAMCRAWCNKSGGCETIWFSPDSLGCSITEPVTRHSSFKQLSHKQDPPDCGGETCLYLAECITSRASVYRCVRPTDIRIPTIYIVQSGEYCTNLLTWGPNADSKPVKQQTFPGRFKEIIYFQLFKCLLVLLLNEFKCISLETLTYKNLCGEKIALQKEEEWMSIAASNSLVFLQINFHSGDVRQSQVGVIYIRDKKCEDMKPYFKTSTTIFDPNDTITEDPISHFLYFSGRCKEDRGKRCIYQSAKLSDWSQSYLDRFHVQSLVFDKIDNTPRFLSSNKVGRLLPNGTSVINRELPGELKGMLSVKGYLILMDNNGMVVLNRDYSTIARYHGTKYYAMTLAGLD